MKKSIFARFEEKPDQRQETLKKHLIPYLRQQIPDPLPSKKFRKASNDTMKQNEPTGSTLGFWEQKANAILRCSLSSKDKELQSGRLILLKWWKILLENVNQVGYTERTLYFECILEIMSRNEFVDYDHTDSLTYDQWVLTISESDTNNLYCDTRPKSLLVEYRRMLNVTLKYAIEKMNQKALYSDIIVFCSKILALCFFKVPGVASSLIRISEIQPNVIRRLRLDMGGLKDCAQYREYIQCVFPQHLHSIMKYDSHTIHTNLSVGNKKSPTEVFGNWARRWRSDDSELFFSFYRQYHSTLDIYISAVFPLLHQKTLHQRNSILAVSPGYVYILSFFASKIDSLIHREINSVTTMHPAQISKEAPSPQLSIKSPANEPFLASESELLIKQNTCAQPLPNLTNNGSDVYENDNKPLDKLMIDSKTMDSQAGILRFGEQAKQTQESMDRECSGYLPQHIGKPPLLEVITKRYAECLVWTSIASSVSGLYQDIINVLLRSVIKKTGLSSVESIYCLLDFIEATVHEIKSIHSKPSDLPVDVPFLHHTLRILLVQSDHSITLLRTLSFVYMHFSFLTPTAELLDHLAIQILLEPSTFERLLLHWGRHVRVFFLRCLIWRVGRVWTPMSIRWGNSHERSMQRGGRSDDILCDGRECLKVWMSNKNVSRKDLHPNCPVEQKKAYDQCALEVHLVLEAMLESFHQQYIHLQKLLGGPEELTGFDKISKIYEHTMAESVTFPPFCSKLVQIVPLKIAPLTPLDERKKSIPRSRYHDNKEKYLSAANNKSRSRKEKFLKVFMPGSKKHDSPEYDDHNDKSLPSFLEIPCNELYTIPSSYTILSLPSSHNPDQSIPTNLSTGMTSRISSNNTGSTLVPDNPGKSDEEIPPKHSRCMPSTNQPQNRSINKIPQNACDSLSQRGVATPIYIKSISKKASTMAKQEPSSTSATARRFLWNHSLPHFTSLTRSNTGSKSLGTKNSRLSKKSNHGSNIQNHTINFTRDYKKDVDTKANKLPKRVLSAHKWRYMPTSHVYADKIVEESKMFVHDYCAWAGKFGYESEMVADNFIPGLSLDWPRNWSYSQM